MELPLIRVEYSHPDQQCATADCHGIASCLELYPEVLGVEALELRMPH